MIGQKLIEVDRDTAPNVFASSLRTGDSNQPTPEEFEPNKDISKDFWAWVQPGSDDLSIVNKLDLWFPTAQTAQTWQTVHLGVDAAGLEGCFLLQTLGKDAIVSMILVSPFFFLL